MVLSRVTQVGSRRRTALWVVPVPELGGVARHVLDTAGAGLPGWNLVVLCPEGMLAQRLRDMGVAVLTGHLGPAAGFHRSLRTLTQHLRHLRPDIVHSHLAYADVVAAAAALRTGVRLVTTEHGIAGDDGIYHGAPWKSQVKALMHRIRLLRADAVIAVSEATRRTMAAKWKPRRPVVVIPNGVDGHEISRRVEELRKASGTAAGAKILSLSRLAPEKGLETLLSAFALVATENQEARLVIAGEGPLRASLEKRAMELGVGHAVEFPGFVDPVAAMADADVLVQLSVWENCSYTLLDAVSAGIRVVATDVGGNPEIVHKDCLVQQNSPHSVAQRILGGVATGTAPLPGGPATITVSDMAARIAAVYEQAAA
ncbi:glycogen(starch) synthase [Pseudarthrobacter sp. W1I19]|uniref:glycosyltransferase family 4 protein n=1 Tax=Pseudarthrobacter sp. W1I19 TaxID=3042288 RepID=UPI0027875289|nr:glycosyltransferase family 4 protein [Pseudarthrobacter sp. W1I19]MDQ0922277.1 glycogen(starch) synthase [Pseudarthrobacter sp. W1I19]